MNTRAKPGQARGGWGGGLSARDQAGDPRGDGLGPIAYTTDPDLGKVNIGYVQAMDWDHEQQVITATYAPCSACGGWCVGHAMR